MAVTSLQLHGRMILVILLYIFSLVFADSCMRRQYNLTILQSFSPWYTISDSTNGTFQISLCDKLAQNSIQLGTNNCPDGTSVCLIYPNGTAVSYGNYTSDPSIQNSTELGSSNELLFVLRGQACVTTAGEFYSTFVHFKCGKTLGHPYYLGDLLCSVHIEWESYIFCKNLPAPEKEVPCTVIKDGHLIDLSPLTKLSGGYLVDEDNENNRKIFINVCRDITAASSDGTQSCPKGSGSCKVSGNTTVDFGKPTRGVEATSGGVRLVYTTAEKPAGCLDYPTTTINFLCPQRGGSKDPVLMSSFLVACSMEIEWVTEFACPTDHISSHTCQLTMEKHDINIDLSPLSRELFNPYTVDVTDGQDHYQYLINVCGVLGNSCGRNEKGTSVCQTKTDDGAFAHSVGEYKSMSLRYSDDKLTMTIKDGDACSSNYKRDTLIEFICNKSAVDDGKGYPEFVEHNSCSYFFQWGTKYACPDHLLSDTCSVMVDGKKFDLSPLVRQQGTNWEVITGQNEHDETYFLNVCHDLLNTHESSLCPPGVAVCRKDSNGAAVSLGRYTQPLQYDRASKSLRLNYTQGGDIKETKEGCKAYTTINFFCAPGRLDSAPWLVHKSQDDCYHEIEWHTSAACVLSHKTGDGCKVVDDDAGYVFDLSPLTLTTGSYTISGGGYNYLINVCASLKDPNYCNSSPHDNAAICQVKLGITSDQKKVAEPTSRLEYFDGVLNLTYTNGEPYNNANHTPRMAEIAFVCDLTVGDGKPEFLEERNLTYVFLWRSSYACPTQPMECVVTDEASHAQYDLSSLSRVSENWQTESLEGSDKKKFYINVCQPLRPIPGVGCSTFASVCATSLVNGKETLFHGNLGRPEKAPVVETSIHGVQLVYTNGDTCVDSDGTTKNFQTILHLSCVPGKVTGGPTSPQLVTPCKYSILWDTEAACPITSAATTGAMCHVTDPNTNFTFNLMPLYTADGYNVTTADQSRTFKINICGSLLDSVCGRFDSKHPTTVCELSRSGNTSLAMMSSDLTYSSQGQMTLDYSGRADHNQHGTNSRFVFNFFCDRTAQTPVITYDGQAFVSTTFKVKTALACAPQPISCKTQDSSGRQFDLTPLARQIGNWIVIDTRPGHGDLRYHINVCHSVNPTPEMTCPGGAVGGCQTGSSGNFSMGYVQSEPVVSSVGGVLTILYKGGDKCHTGKDNESFRSTRIIFFCDNVEHDPVFEEESSTCEYTFTWKTPSACPQQVTTGSDCKVTDPLYNHEFDLSSLRHTSDNYIVSGGAYQFLLNVCGPLVKAPGTCAQEGVAACQSGSSLPQPVPIGVFNDKPVYNSGQISLVYSEGKGSCHNNFTRSTVINFMCDHSQTGTTYPQFVDEKSDCTYVFEWHTSVVCPPHQISDCTFQRGEDVFDLSRLTLVDGNYERVYNDSRQAFIINVCRSLVHKKDQTCPFDAAACMIDLAQTDMKKKFHNIGEVTSQSISYEHNTLTLKYGNGEMCADGKTRRSTVILFQCDTSTDALGSPSGHFTINECDEHFVWTSSAACPLKKQVDDHSTGFGTCQVTNLNTGYVFDLSGLTKSKGYKIYDREGHEFTLNVCAWLDSSSPCRNGTGSCQVSQFGDKTSMSAGDANGHLLYRDGVLMLQYSGGDTCDISSKVPRATYINFVCVPGAGNGVPVYIDKSGDCLYYFDWQTQLACETEFTCEVTTDTGFTLDLSPLVKKSGKYNVLPNNGNHIPGMIYINLCRPLNPIFGTLCPAGSGACLVRDGQKSLSLGRINSGPVWDGVSKNVKLTYTNGDPCPANLAVNMTSVILLRCGTQEQMEPQLEAVTSNCQYIFIWETALACTERKPQQLTSNCTFYDYIARKKYDLSSLSDQVDVKSSHGGTFNIKVCGHIEEKGEKGEASCDQSSVCLSGEGTRNGSYGNSSHGIFQKDTEFVALTFSGGRTCHSGSGKAVSTIYFKCDRRAGKGIPEIIDNENECEVTFRWTTSLVCPLDRKECLIANSKAMYDLTFLSQDTGSWNVTDGNDTIYWLNLCQPLHGPAISAGCPDSAAACRLTPDRRVLMLGQLDTQTISMTDGPKPTITIQYTDGNPDACNIGRRRRSDLTPKVIVNLVCSETIGSPVFQHRSPENVAKCVFEFTWATKMACAVGFKNVPVTEIKGQITDTRTQMTVNLKPLFSLDNIEQQVGNTKYIINLGSAVKLDHSLPEELQCQGAAICQVSHDSKSYKNLGNFSTKTYYMTDEHLEVEFTSSDKCADSLNHLNVTTTIMFTCSPGQDKTTPKFLYQTSDCHYIFNWDTSHVCLLGSPSPGAPGKVETAGSGGAGSGGGGAKIAIGVSVLLAIVVACVLILLLHKPERRALIGFRLKSIIQCRKAEDSPIVYSRLSQSDHDNSVIDGFRDPFNPFGDADDEAEINNSQLPVRPASYHDDSDEDMLL